VAPVVGNLFQLTIKADPLTSRSRKWRQLRPFIVYPIARGHQTARDSLPIIKALMQVLRKNAPGTFRRSKAIESVMDRHGRDGVVSAEGEPWSARCRRDDFEAFQPGAPARVLPSDLKITQDCWNAPAAGGVDRQAPISKPTHCAHAGWTQPSLRSHESNTIDGATARRTQLTGCSR